MPEKDPSRASGQLEFHDFLLREMRTGMGDIRKDVKEYREETIKLVQRLDDHIATCDKRQTDARRNATPTVAHQIVAAVTAPQPAPLFSKEWLIKKTAERLLDYAVFAGIILIIFAFQHGFHLPLPTG